MCIDRQLEWRRRSSKASEAQRVATDQGRVSGMVAPSVCVMLWLWLCCQGRRDSEERECWTWSPKPWMDMKPGLGEHRHQNPDPEPRERRPSLVCEGEETEGVSGVERSGGGREGWRNGVKPGPIDPGYVKPRATGHRAYTVWRGVSEVTAEPFQTRAGGILTASVSEAHEGCDKKGGVKVLYYISSSGQRARSRSAGEAVTRYQCGGRSGATRYLEGA
jgi:hypothetical protein